MFRKMLRAKIHRATINQADLSYEGSITIPEELMRAADLAEFEAVQVWNVSSGARFETYVLRGAQAGHICVNGAAARLVQPGDLAIVAAFADVEEARVWNWAPRVVFVDEANRIKEIRGEAAANNLRAA